MSTKKQYDSSLPTWVAVHHCAGGKETPGGCTFFEVSNKRIGKHPDKVYLCESTCSPERFVVVKGDNYNDGMQKAYDQLGWGVYKPMEE